MESFWPVLPAIGRLDDTFRFSHLLFEVLFLEKEDLRGTHLHGAILIGTSRQEAAAEFAGIGQPQGAIALIQHKPQVSEISNRFQQSSSYL